MYHKHAGELYTWSLV